MKKPATNLHDKSKCAIHIRNLKQALNYGLILKQVHIIINKSKLSYYKIFHRKFISNKNKKNSNINE